MFVMMMMMMMAEAEPWRYAQVFKEKD